MRGSDPQAIRVLHILPHLQQGGAESTLANLVDAGMPGIEQSVCTLMPGPHHFQVEAPVYSGTARRGRYSLGMIMWVRQVIRSVQPHIIHSWMYHCNLIATAVAPSSARIVWSVHHESPETIEKFSTRMISRACAMLSHRCPAEIVYVARAAIEAHRAAGYAADKGIVIANGIDLERFTIPKRAPLDADRRIRIGLVARFDPVKGHKLLIDTVAKHRLRHRIDLVFAGKDCDVSPELSGMVARAGLQEQTTILGMQDRIEDVYASLDVLAIPSQSEALPLVALEAAAMGLPVIASRVGDIPRLGLDPSLLFTPGSRSGCAAALDASIELLSNPDFPQFQRAKIAKRYCQSMMAEGYGALYRRVLDAPARDMDAGALTRAT